MICEYTVYTIYKRHIYIHISIYIHIYTHALYTEFILQIQYTVSTIYYMHAYMDTCIHGYMHTWMHAYMDICTHASMHACIYTSTSTGTLEHEGLFGLNGSLGHMNPEGPYTAYLQTLVPKPTPGTVAGTGVLK